MSVKLTDTFSADLAEEKSTKIVNYFVSLIGSDYLMFELEVYWTMLVPG